MKYKAGYTATKVVCGWAGAKSEVTRPVLRGPLAYYPISSAPQSLRLKRIRTKFGDFVVWSSFTNIT